MAESCGSASAAFVMLSSLLLQENIVILEYPNENPPRFYVFFIITEESIPFKYMQSHSVYVFDILSRWIYNDSSGGDSICLKLSME